MTSIPAEDRLPHDRAVWREEVPSGRQTANHPICIDYGGGVIERTTLMEADWPRMIRWRFGWPPS